MEVPPAPLVVRADGNDTSTLHINDSLAERTFFSAASPFADSASAFFPFSTAPSAAAAAATAKAQNESEMQQEDQNVRTLFCMMIQMQNIMKGIQENVGTLDSRVTLLETGGVLNKPKTHFTSEQSPTNSAPTTTTSTARAEDSTPEASFSLENDFAAENEEMATQHQQQQHHHHHHHQQHREQTTPPRTSTSSPRDFIVDPSSRASFGGDEFSSDGNLLPERSEVDGSACDVDATDEGPLTPLAIKLFAQRDETPTNSLSPDNQIPYISRRTLWKKANKPKWKRRSDLVPRLKEIVNEKFKAEDILDKLAAEDREGPSGNFKEANGDCTPSKSRTKPLSMNMGSIRTSSNESCLDLIPQNVYPNKTAFPNLLAPVCLAPIWRSTDVASESPFAQSISTSERPNAVFNKTAGETAYEDRPPHLDPPPSEPASKPEFMCGICFKVLGSKSSLDTHTRSIHENRKFPCNDCGKRFFDRSTLRRHKKCIHENITHRCKFCSLEFSRRHYLTSHVQKEHPGKVAAESTAGIKGTAAPAGTGLPIGFYNEIEPTIPTNGAAQSEERFLGGSDKL